MHGLPERSEPVTAVAAKMPLAQCRHTLTLGMIALADWSSLDCADQPTLVQIFEVH